MVGTAEAFRIYFVNVFRPGRTRCEPTAWGHYLQSADGAAIAGCTVEDGLNLFAGQIR